MQGHVSVIGAGPGDPGLISVRGLELLRAADVVIYDKAAKSLLRWARPGAETIEAGGPAEGRVAQDALSMLIADKAREGKSVARLKWGDPFVFDSGGKEALFVHEQRIPFEVVPGISAAVGVTAYAGIPLSYPGSGDAIVLLRGSEDNEDGLPDVDWSALARLDGTIVSSVSGRLGGAMLHALASHGRAGDAPAALIFDGTLPSQRTVVGTIDSLTAALQDDAMQRPATLVIGEVANLREHLRWFDERPLFGRRIIITRSREQAHELAAELEQLGAETIEAPIFRLAPPDDPETMDRTTARIDQYQWAIFASANAVSRFFNSLLAGPRDLRALGHLSICAVGANTADRLEARGIKPDVVVPEWRVEAIVDAISARGPLQSSKALIVRPDYLRDALALELARHDASVTDLVAYHTETAAPESEEAQEIYRLLLDGRVDAVTFTSPTAVQRFAALIGGADQSADLLRSTAVLALGPVTRAAVEALGVERVIVPAQFNVDALIEALVDHFNDEHAGAQ